MNDILTDIKNLCNYSEREYSNSTFLYNYIEMTSNSVEEIKRREKIHNRSLAIDILIGVKNEQEWDNRHQSSDMEMDTLEMQVKTIQLQRQNYNTIIDIKTYLLNKIESITKSSFVGRVGSSLDITLSNDNDQDKRKIISRIMMCSNLISINTRSTSGTSIVLHPSTYNKYKQEIDNLRFKIITSTIISYDKIVIIGVDNNDNSSGGLILVHSTNNKCFYCDLTTNGNNNFVWFNLI